MKNLYTLISLFLFLFITSCTAEFIDRQPQGQLSPEILANEKGAEALLIAAYSALDGWVSWGPGNPWASAASNWTYGDVLSDDAYKGSVAHEQLELSQMEKYQFSSNNSYGLTKWKVVYDGVARANDVLRALEQATDVPAARKKEMSAEARFLRGHFHFEAKKIFGAVPFINEKTADFRVANTKDIWPMIEADFEFATENLPQTQAEVGRASRYAAMALLAKAHLFQQEFQEAKPLLEEIIQSGAFKLADCFHYNFNADYNNHSESIFQIQFSVNEGTDGENGNFGDILNYPNGAGPGACCGFNQPSQNLVNAFKTHPQTGLPLLDTFNDQDVKNDQGLESSDPFISHSGTLDPRLDWTVGRRGIPYLDWGDHPGKDWIRSQAYGGPYSPMKNVYTKEQEGRLSTATGWAKGANANNYNLIRYADVILWAAEVEVETGNLEKAREYVNSIRRRARNGCQVTRENGSPAANYLIDEYKEAWADQDMARKAVRFERRLELALEGHRFFDLRRWDILSQTLNAYLATEKNKRSYLADAIFEEDCDSYQPIPQTEIEVSLTDEGVPTLEQHTCY